MPRGGFVAMVDAMFCMIAILVVLIVTLPRDPSEPGRPPRADLVVGCEGSLRDGWRFVVARAGGGVERRDAPIRLEDRTRVLRALVEDALAPIAAPTARVLALVPPGQILYPCLTSIACALGAAAPCYLPEVPPWRDGIARAIVELGFSEEPVGDERG